MLFVLQTANTDPSMRTDALPAHIAAWGGTRTTPTVFVVVDVVDIGIASGIYLFGNVHGKERIKVGISWTMSR